MSFYTKIEFDTAKDIVLKHRVLAISFLQVMMGIGYKKAGMIFSELQKDEKYNKFPTTRKNANFKIKPIYSSSNLSTKKDLIERLYSLFDDKIGREAVKYCLKNFKHSDTTYKFIFNEVQAKFGTGYARTDSYIQIAKALQKIIEKE